MFDGRTGGEGSTYAQKGGAVLEVPSYVSLNAAIKSNSPYGSLVLEDVQTQGGYMAQRFTVAVLDYNLKLDAELNMNNGGGNYGANRLEVRLNFQFSAQCKPGNGQPSMGPPPGGGGGGGMGPQWGAPPCGAMP